MTGNLYLCSRRIYSPFEDLNQLTHSVYYYIYVFEALEFLLKWKGNISVFISGLVENTVDSAVEKKKKPIETETQYPGNIIYHHLQQQQQKPAHKALHPRNPGTICSYNDMVYQSFYALKNNQTKSTDTIYRGFPLQNKHRLPWIQTLLQGSW